MSSSYDSGYYSTQAMEKENEQCSKTKKPHRWEIQQPLPSRWDKCKDCGATRYWK